MTDLKLIHRGKVREMYHVDEKLLLMVSTDQKSALETEWSDNVPFDSEEAETQDIIVIDVE